MNTCREHIKAFLPLVVTAVHFTWNFLKLVRRTRRKPRLLHSYQPRLFTMLASIFFVSFSALLVAAASNSPSPTTISLVLPNNLYPGAAPTAPASVDPKVPITASVVATSSSTTTYQLACKDDGACILESVQQPFTLTAGPTFYQHGFGVPVDLLGVQTYTEALNQHCEFTDSAALTCTASSIGPVWALEHTNNLAPTPSGASTKTQISTSTDSVQTLTGMQLTTVAIEIVSGLEKLGTKTAVNTTTPSTTSIPSATQASATSASSGAAAPTANAVGMAGTWAAAVAVGLRVFF